MAKGNGRVSEGQPAKPGRLNPSTGAGKADASRSDAPTSPRTPAATIRAAIEKAYGNLLSKLEGKGLVTIAQTEREAIEAAAQARADKTGGDVEQIKRSMLASITCEVKGIIRVWPINAPNGKNWVVTRNTFNGTHHLGYFTTESEANESAEQERTEATRSPGSGARWWVENPPQLIQSTSLGKLDSLGRARVLKSTLDAIHADPLTAPRMPAAAIVAAIVRKYRLEASPPLV